MYIDRDKVNSSKCHQVEHIDYKIRLLSMQSIYFVIILLKVNVLNRVRNESLENYGICL